AALGAGTPGDRRRAWQAGRRRTLHGILRQRRTQTEITTIPDRTRPLPGAAVRRGLTGGRVDLRQPVPPAHGDTLSMGRGTNHRNRGEEYGCDDTPMTRDRSREDSDGC